MLSCMLEGSVSSIRCCHSSSLSSSYPRRREDWCHRPCLPQGLCTRPWGLGPAVLTTRHCLTSLSRSTVSMLRLRQGSALTAPGCGEAPAPGNSRS